MYYMHVVKTTLDCVAFGAEKTAELLDLRRQVRDAESQSAERLTQAESRAAGDSQAALRVAQGKARPLPLTPRPITHTTPVGKSAAYAFLGRSKFQFSLHLNKIH